MSDKIKPSEVSQVLLEQLKGISDAERFDANRNPRISQFPRQPLYKEKLRNLPMLRKNERKAKGRNKHFLNFCSQIITFSIFLIIFVHRTPNVGQE